MGESSVATMVPVASQARGRPTSAAVAVASEERTIKGAEEDGAPEASEDPCEVCAGDVVGGGWFGRV